MSLMKAKLIAKKIFLWAKKFWWAIILALLFILAGLFSVLTRNGALLAGVLDLLESKRGAHAKEMETLSRVHDTEVSEKNARLREHEKRRAELEEEFKKRGETLDKEREAELKRLVDEGYNDPEKLARALREAFGLDND
jgi:flagellar motility protein MotE (MotC chaperone)